MKKILSEEQFKKWEAKQHQRKGKMRHKKHQYQAKQ
jgi:hypothetical protein